ncbi:hypothetical protein [Miniphocaeibacter halophilus]|uniref:Uncharacterized protein n=1 Tax=Miniphocaeibacter halophilus TaxID=2931922 RepID=A0AC61MQM5_9FIRM|nr:hypothetical protein [Miniphocaeibacter halophilus]QQK07866.1 hypothetical protein JFY71_11425 [Miniphocaeibacter halophilus]
MEKSNKKIIYLFFTIMFIMINYILQYYRYIFAEQVQVSFCVALIFTIFNVLVKPETRGLKLLILVGGLIFLYVAINNFISMTVSLEFFTIEGILEIIK